MPPRSTNAPYSVMFLMTPLTTLPSSRVSSVLVFCLVALLLEEHAAAESTMLPRFLLNLMTLNW